MKFALLPWKPELIFTGTSIMGINPETGKFCSHVVTSFFLNFKVNERIRGWPISYEFYWIHLILFFIYILGSLGFDTEQRLLFCRRPLGCFQAGIDVLLMMEFIHKISFSCFSNVYFLQLRFYKTPELESPKYLILKRTPKYEVCFLLPFA